ncbi:MAG: hypothetical protein ACKOCM_11575 [Cyanobacteriota bacterium]
MVTPAGNLSRDAFNQRLRAGRRIRALTCPVAVEALKRPQGSSEYGDAPLSVPAAWRRGPLVMATIPSRSDCNSEGF